MSRWNHSICWNCWKRQEGEREPVRVVNPKEGACCFCGTPHASGIFVRRDPDSMQCDHAKAEGVK